MGHCGTLDPIATGLLLLTLGRGTKIQDLLMSEDKEYAGTLTLGVDDRHPGSARRNRRTSVEFRRSMKATIRAAFEKFRGDFYQMPPMVSAIKQGGVPLYKLARQGKVVEREPRLVHVYRYAIDRDALAGNRFQRPLQQRFLCPHVCARYRRGTRLRRASEISAAHEVRTFRCGSAITVVEIKTVSREQILSRILSLPEVSRMRGA